MANNDIRAELLKVMKEHKMYSLPIKCGCGYKAKDDNWIDMEKHYEVCHQFRNLVKVTAIKHKKSKGNV